MEPVMTLAEVAKLSEEEARATYERIRWPNGPVCPHCGNADSETITRFQGKAHRVGVLKCNACEEQFTATVGTIMEGSHLPIRLWLMAFALLCSSKKSLSALQLQRQLGIGSYRTAWHMAMRIRWAMKREPLAGLLAGTIEVDEKYVGGRPRPHTGNTRTGRGTKKAPVVAMVERQGRVRAFPVKNVTANTLKGLIRDNVDHRSTIMTDDFASYSGIGKEFQGGHFVISHSQGQYAWGHITTNTVEGYFALLQRGLTGSFHHVSTKHLGRYCDEFSFRWDYRKVNDGERTVRAIQQSGRGRLKYRSLIAEAGVSG
jgi:transposase-like protein